MYKRLILLALPAVLIAGVSLLPMSTASAAPASSRSGVTSGRTVSDACGTAIRKTATSYWGCAFVDDFNGGSLDLGKWSVQTTAETGFRNAQECYVNSPNNVRVANGALTLTARQESQPSTCGYGEGAFDTQYTGGMVTSYGKFAQAYGRFEFRAKFPSTKVPGVQSALWMWPQNQALYGTWPTSGEIDVAEFFSAYPDRAIPYLHYTPVGEDPNVTNNNCLVSSLSTKFHTFTLEWSPTSMKILYDGRTCLENTNWLSALGGRAPFDQPFLISMTQGLGLFGNALTPGTPLPATMTIDYVKVWK